MKDIETKRLSNDELENVAGGSKDQNDELLKLINKSGAKYNGQEVTEKNLGVFLKQYGIMALINKERGCNQYTLFGTPKPHEDIKKLLEEKL